MWPQAAGLLVALVLAGPIPAEELVTGGEETLLARVVTGGLLPHECLAPVVIDRVDGEKRALPAQGFSIEAGQHRLNGKALLDTEKCRPLEVNQYIPPTAGLSMEFVAGNVYYLAYDRSHPDAGQWGLVVWKVEQEVVAEPGERPPADIVQ